MFYEFSEILLFDFENEKLSYLEDEIKELKIIEDDNKTFNFIKTITNQLLKLKTKGFMFSENFTKNLIFVNNKIIPFDLENNLKKKNINFIENIFEKIFEEIYLKNENLNIKMKMKINTKKFFQFLFEENFKISDISDILEYKDFKFWVNSFIYQEKKQEINEF